MPKRPPEPVIVVPGITATYLKDRYPLPPRTMWSVLRKDYERIRLHPDDLRYEAEQPSLGRADQVYEVAYEELIEELRYNLTDHKDQPVPVFPFEYDWRQPLQRLEEQLSAFVDEVIQRTRLMRHYHKAGFSDAPRVNLVGHSMGGLVIAGFLERFGAEKIGRIATLATPFRGSFEAMVKMTTGTANLGGPTPSSREREAARLTPSLYHLLPDTEDSIETASGLPTSTFDPDFWQPSIVETIVDYVRDHGIQGVRTAAERRERGRSLFRSLLESAHAHRGRVTNLDLSALDFAPERWLCVIGVDALTRVRMTVESRRGKPQFKLSSKDRRNDWGERDAESRKLTGDGTVHFSGAIPPFLPYESLVCITPGDFGYWEAADRVLAARAGFHGILPNMNMIHRMLVRFFTASSDPRRNTWGRPAPGVEKSAWSPPISLRRKK